MTKSCVLKLNLKYSNTYIHQRRLKTFITA